MDPQPGDQILEIGCGRGELAAVLCQAFGAGSYVGIDRSRIAIAASLRRDLGDRAQFLALALRDAHRLNRRFDKVVALNVNVFWQRADVELVTVRDLMLPHARLYLAFRPPATRGVGDLLAQVHANLEDGGLRILRNCVDAAGHTGCTIAELDNRSDRR